MKLLLLLLSFNLVAATYTVDLRYSNRGCPRGYETYCPNITLFTVQQREATLYFDRLCFELKHLRGKLYLNGCSCYDADDRTFAMHDAPDILAEGFTLYDGDDLIADKCYWLGEKFTKEQINTYNMLSVKPAIKPMPKYIRHFERVTYGK